MAYGLETGTTTTQPNAFVTYQSRYMILAVHSNASYLSETNFISISGGQFFMSSDFPDPPNNGSILTISQIIKTVIFLAVEAEMGDLCINFKETIPT